MSKTFCEEKVCLGLENDASKRVCAKGEFLGGFPEGSIKKSGGVLRCKRLLPIFHDIILFYLAMYVLPFLIYRPCCGTCKRRRPARS